jgi:hypothetical protein
MSKVDPIFNNALRLYKRFKRSEYQWLAMLGRYSVQDVYSFSKPVMKNAHVKVSGQLGMEIARTYPVKYRKLISAQPSLKKAS